MKLNGIIESDGIKRQIIDFDSEGRPVTKPYNGEPTKEEEPPKEEITESATATETETAEPTAEESTVVDGEPTEVQTTVFKCQYCGREIKSKVGLNAHEKACKENPANK